MCATCTCTNHPRRCMVIGYWVDHVILNLRFSLSPCSHLLAAHETWRLPPISEHPCRHHCQEAFSERFSRLQGARRGGLTNASGVGWRRDFRRPRGNTFIGGYASCRLATTGKYRATRRLRPDDSAVLFPSACRPNEHHVRAERELHAGELASDESSLARSLLPSMSAWFW